MIGYKNGLWQTVTVPDQYQIDIVPEIVTAVKVVLPNFSYGALQGKIQYPSGVFGQMSEQYKGYASGKAWQKKVVFYFQIRTTNSKETVDICNEIRACLSPLYDMRVRARRDFVEQEISIQDFTLEFIVNYRGVATDGNDE